MSLLFHRSCTDFFICNNYRLHMHTNASPAGGHAVACDGDGERRGMQRQWRWRTSWHAMGMLVNVKAGRALEVESEEG